MFGFKKSVDDIVGLIEKLSDDEKQELLSRISDHKPDTTDEKEIAEAEADDKGESGEEAKASEDESVAAQEEESGNEDSQTAEDRIHESEGTELADEEKTAEKSDEPPMAETSTDGSGNLDDAQSARIAALESEVSALKELISKFMGEDENRDFGLSGHAPEADNRREERASAVMRAYAGNRAGDYM